MGGGGDSPWQVFRVHQILVQYMLLSDVMTITFYRAFIFLGTVTLVVTFTYHKICLEVHPLCAPNQFYINLHELIED